MTPEKQQLLQLIDDYLDAVTAAINLLNTKYKQDQTFLATFERRGYLDEAQTSSYQFHGIGCLVTTPDFEVDFDFSHGSRRDAIDPWFLAHFWLHNYTTKNKCPALHHDEQIIRLLQDLVADKLLLKGLNDYDPDSSDLWLASPRPLPPLGWHEEH